MILMTTERFHALAEALLHAKADWFADKPDVDAYKHILAEVGDIWPASILDDVAGDERAIGSSASTNAAPS